MNNLIYNKRPQAFNARRQVGKSTPKKGKKQQKMKEGGGGGKIISNKQTFEETFPENSVTETENCAEGVQKEHYDLPCGKKRKHLKQRGKKMGWTRTGPPIQTEETADIHLWFDEMGPIRKLRGNEKTEHKGG